MSTENKGNMSCHTYLCKNFCYNKESQYCFNCGTCTNCGITFLNKNRTICNGCKDDTKNNIEHEVTEVLKENKYRLALTTFVHK